MNKFMARAANRDYSKFWAIPDTLPYILQQPKPAICEKRPISTKDNYIRCIKGEKPLWMPLFQWEANIVWPDAIEEHPVPDVEGFDWWGTEWKEAVGSMSVKPGTRVISDFANWKEELQWPDLSLVDFKTDGIKMSKTLDPERVHIYETVEGMYERLHELIPFEESLLAFYDEPELLQEFFARMIDYKIECCEKVFSYYGRIDGVNYHDDWGTQRSGFFSNKMFSEQIMPQTKRLVDYIKSTGRFVELHSCGKNTEYLPYMIEMGFDMWAPQIIINDYDYMFGNYNDKISFAFAIPLTPEMDEKTVRSTVRDFVDRYGGNGRILAWIRDGACNPEHFNAAREELYNYSLEYYQRLWS